MERDRQRERERERERDELEKLTILGIHFHVTHDEQIGSNTQNRKSTNLRARLKRKTDSENR